jgi:hypothetical protein
MEGSCVLLEEAVQRLRWLIVWPAGYQLRDTTILGSDGQVVARVGDVVDLGGGEYPASEYQTLRPQLVVEPSPTCLGPSFWVTNEVTRR